MTKRTLISQSKVPDDFFSVKSKPLPKVTERRLKAAAEQANENIRRNNLIYSQSNAHAKEYTLSLGMNKANL